jgi:hypothetical protein
MDLKELIIKKRPHLKETTVKTYFSILKSLYKKVYPSDKDIDIKKFDETEKIITYLTENYKPSVRKTYLSGLVVITENDKYREQMMEDVETTNKELETHEMTKKQVDNYITNTEVSGLIQSLKNEVKLIYKNQSYTPENIITIQNWILMLLFSGKYTSPRRSMDWYMFKIKNIGDADNFLDGDEFVFRSYKTSSTYGEQRVKVPSALLKIIHKYISVIPESQEYLFFTITGKQLSAVTINQRFNGLFLSKNVSVNNFRHLFLSHKYQKNIHLNKDLKDMGTSSKQLATYIQRGDFR